MLKSKFYLALGLVLGLSLLVGGATFALFSAQTTSAGNTFTAATLNLTSARDQGDTVPGPMFYVTSQQGATPSGALGQLPTDVWAPGDHFVRTLTVFNPSDSSSLDAWLDSVSASISSGDTALANKLWVEVATPDSSNVYQPVASGWLSQFVTGNVPMSFSNGNKIPCFVSGNRQLQFTVTLDSSAGNDLQGSNLVVDFSVHATQMLHNP